MKAVSVKGREDEEKKAATLSLILFACTNVSEFSDESLKR